MTKISALLFVFPLLCLSSEICHAATRNASTKQNLVKVTCSGARYRSLCIKTLTPFSPPANKASDFAQVAVSDCLNRTRHISGFVTKLAKRKTVSKREKAALSDCLDELSDAVDQLRQTLSALRLALAGNFRFQMSNAQTWASAALTDDDTCMDGFGSVSSAVKTAVRKKIRNLTRVMSNALFLINRAAAARAGSN